jgi:hypothetical protein
MYMCVCVCVYIYITYRELKWHHITAGSGGLALEEALHLIACDLAYWACLVLGVCVCVCVCVCLCFVCVCVYYLASWACLVLGVFSNAEQTWVTVTSKSARYLAVIIVWLDQIYLPPTTSCCFTPSYYEVLLLLHSLLALLVQTVFSCDDSN